VADVVYNVVKAPVVWMLFLDGVRVGGVYGTKEAAFEAAMVAASFSVRDGVQVSVPSDGRLSDVEQTEPWPKERNAFLKRWRPPAGGQASPPLLQSLPGGFIMIKNAFDRWWEWVEKPPDSYFNKTRSFP
jgi:hypothetical protein